MIANRRSILAFLGMAPVAAGQVGQSLGAGMGYSPGYAVSPAPPVDWGDASAEAVNWGIAKEQQQIVQRQSRKRLLDMLRKGIVPADVKRAMLQDYGHMNLDADLKANRSFSLTAKHRIQRERFLARRITQLQESLDEETPSLRDRVSNMFGVYL